jgi:hypothetical protein
MRHLVAAQVLLEEGMAWAPGSGFVW